MACEGPIRHRSVKARQSAVRRSDGIMTEALSASTHAQVASFSGYGLAGDKDRMVRSQDLWTHTAACIDEAVNG